MLLILVLLCLLVVALGHADCLDCERHKALAQRDEYRALYEAERRARLALLANAVQECPE